MKKNNDFDFIKNAFEKENITAPYSLNEELIINRLDGTEQKKIRFYQRKSFKSIVSAAACIAIAVAAITAARPYLVDNNVTTDNEPSMQEPLLSTFTSVDDIKSTVKEIENNKAVYENKYGLMGGGVFLDAAMPETAKNITTTAEGGSRADSYADTYRQVDAVDEADIIKNDGKYIYYVSTNHNCIKIYETASGEGKLVSQIDDFRISDYGDSSADEYIQDIFIYNSTLVVNTYKFEYSEDYSRAEELSLVHLYDVSDASEPEEINTLSQSGTYVSSRLIGNQIYYVSNDYVYSNKCKTDDDYVPYICNGKGAEKMVIPCHDIAYGSNPDTASYLIVSAINIETGERSTDTKAIFGAGSNIYCNENNMYITMGQWRWKRDIALLDSVQPIESKTQIVKVSLSANSIQFTATCEVAGDVNNQFSLDEKDGRLRVATTSYNEKDERTNNLFVFDENLNKIGEITGFADNESIQAVRFIGDTAYVITYEQVDPLFVIDLSDPASPQIKGEVEITGFSSLLVPVDENTLLGIGYSTYQGEYGEATDGLKLALFDISDHENPTVLDSYVLNDAYSEAQYNHHALVVNYDKGYYAIPYEIYDGNSYKNTSGALTFEINGEKIHITNQFVIEGTESAVRCTYADDDLYVFDYSGCANVFTVD